MFEVCAMAKSKLAKRYPKEFRHQSQKVDIDRTDTFVFGVSVENGFEGFSAAWEPNSIAEWRLQGCPFDAMYRQELAVSGH